MSAERYTPAKLTITGAASSKIYSYFCSPFENQSSLEMKRLRVVSWDGTTTTVKIEEAKPLLAQLDVPLGFLTFYEGERLRSGDTFLSRGMTDNDYIDLVYLLP